MSLISIAQDYAISHSSVNANSDFIFYADSLTKGRMNISEVVAHLMAQTIVDGKPITQARLAEATGVPQSGISRLLSGRHSSVGLDNMMALARFWEISLDQLAGLKPLAEKEWSLEARKAAEMVDSLDDKAREEALKEIDKVRRLQELDAILSAQQTPNDRRADGEAA